MNRAKALPESELAASGRKVIKVGETDILLIATREKVYAIANQCPHLNLPVQNGKVTEQGTIVCQWHRSEFNLEDGSPAAWSTWPPGVGKVLASVSKEKPLRTYSVRREEGTIWVEMPD